jgi:predicted TPR repeat methyltransferase
MKPLRKKVSLKDTATDATTALRELFVEQPKAYVREARVRLKDLPKSNFELACRFAREGKWFDAVFRFRITLMLAPDYPNAQYNLGGCYIRMGKIEQGKAALMKALQQSPNNPDALFMLASVDPGALSTSQQPTTMPMAMVTAFFTRVAEGYDQSEAANKYQAGKVMFDLIKPHVTAATPVVVDLGCGSGIAVRPWRSIASNIHGVDVTPAMAELASAATHEQKKLFDKVNVGDARILPTEITAASADIVLAVNMAQFVGNLAPVMQSAASSLKPGGIFAITTEPTKSASGFGLVTETSRFGHSPAYVKQVASDAGFTLLKESAVQLYAGVTAAAYLFSKGNP